MDRFWFVAILAVPVLIGLVNLLRRKRRLIVAEEFANEYFQKLGDYIKSAGNDVDAYDWLVHRVNKMQGQLGEAGVFAAFRPPFANYQVRNYPALLNMLPELRNALGPSISSNRLANDYANTLQDLLVRHLGTLSDRLDEIEQLIKNPIVWLREGMRALIALPISVLGWVGILGMGTVQQITGSRPFQILSGLVSLVGFFGIVMGLVVDWAPFVRIVTDSWRNYF